MEKQQQILTNEIIQILESGLGKLSPLPHKANDGPAKKFQFKGAPGVVGFITPISSHFCSECNRLRLTSRGYLRPCLLNDYEKDILTPLREGATDDQLKEIIRSSLKPQNCLKKTILNKQNLLISMITNQSSNAQMLSCCA